MVVSLMAEEVVVGPLVVDMLNMELVTLLSVCTSVKLVSVLFSGLKVDE